jgi:phage tail sheath protein FI
VTWDAAAAFAYRRRAILIVDPPRTWERPADITPAAVAALITPGETLVNATLYFPRIQAPDPLRENALGTFAASGAIAGVYARTDEQEGVWSSPAGTDKNLIGVAGLATNVTNADTGQLNPRGINVLRTFPTRGSVVWGARTMHGADTLASEWKYVPVRRTALFLEESIDRGTRWTTFEPNDEPLWAELRLHVGSFMHDLFRRGAFQGQSPRDAYFVKCDSSTTTQSDIDNGLVNIVVGFAPLKPAEFVILRIGQRAGQQPRRLRRRHPNRPGRR